MPTNQFFFAATIKDESGEPIPTAKAVYKLWHAGQPEIVNHTQNAGELGGVSKSFYPESRPDCWGAEFSAPGYVTQTFCGTNHPWFLKENGIDYYTDQRWDNNVILVADEGDGGAGEG